MAIAFQYFLYNNETVIRFPNKISCGSQTISICRCNWLLSHVLAREFLLVFPSVKKKKMRKTQGDATKRNLREGSRGDDFSRGQKRARHFRNNAGQISCSLDGTPRRAAPKPARRWTEKEAEKKRVKRKKDGRRVAERMRGPRHPR